MKNKRRLLAVLVVVVMGSANAAAQGWLNKLKEKAVDKIKEKIENKVEKTAGDAADDVLGGG